jgi:hypothetical protein
MIKDDKCGAPQRSSKGKRSSWSGSGCLDSGEMPSMQTIPKTKCYQLAVPVVQQQGAAAAAAAAAAQRTATAATAGVAATRQLVIAQAAPVTVSMSIGSIAVAAGGLAAATVSSSSSNLALEHVVAAADTAAAGAAVKSQQQQQQQQLARVMELREVPVNIRAAFVAVPGWVILDADYNQIELRVMAHASQDAQLMAAFGSQCGDVFRALGAKWLKKPEAEVGTGICVLLL